jgi:ribosomal-protein-alanine N-acetyltransferase
VQVHAAEDEESRGPTRLLLREFRQADVETFHVKDNFGRRVSEFCFDSYREWGMGPWAMQYKERGVIVGNCGFCRIRYDRISDALEYCGEVNYYVAPRSRGQGLASEALVAILTFGFCELRLTRIQARCAPENVSSEHVMRKAGLKFEQMIDSGKGNSSEQRLLAISREDFQALRSSSPY